MRVILIIDNYDSFTFNLVQSLSELHRDVRVVRNDQTAPELVRSARPDAIVISPGPGGPAQAGMSLAVVTQLAGAIPILGVCLGHQVIAAAYGARIVRAQRLMHGKTSRVWHDHRSLFRGVANPFPAMRYHSLLVERNTLPACFEVSAWTEEEEIMAIRHRELPVEGIQFHPESFLTPSGKQLLANFLQGLS